MKMSFGVRLSILTVFTLAMGALLGDARGEGPTNDADREAMVERIGREIEFLCSEEMEGRGVQTKGIELAADYIREEFKKAGLTSGVEDGSYYQTFAMPIRNALAKDKCQLVFSHAGEDVTLNLQVGDGYQPQQIGGNAELKGEVVFVGYGIDAEEYSYQDYAEIDVEGKIVILLRNEPQQDDSDSVFEGDETTEYSYIQTKIATAAANKAAAIILVNDPYSVEQAGTDELEHPSVFGTNSMGTPFFHVKNEVIDAMLSATPLEGPEGEAISSLADAQSLLDSTLTPISQPIEGWSCQLASVFETVQIETSNVIGVIEGEGPLADETIVIGAHYDHLGYGGRGSRAPGRYEIHYGADDNATGTVAVLELARRYAAAESKPQRRLVFIAFTAEESGLIGSSYYVENPLFPLADTVAMINFDMIGRLRNNSLTLFGVTTGEEFRGLCREAAEGTDLDLTIPPNAFAGSDHLPFFRREIPDIFIHTGLTDVYHTPEDSFDTINVPGAVDVIDYSDRLLASITAMPERPTFSAGEPRQPRRAIPYLGAQPDFGSSEEGMYLRGVTEDSPASEAGLKTGDVVLTMDGDKVMNQQQLFGFLRDREAGAEVTVSFKRDGEVMETTVTLGEPRGRGQRGGRE